MILTEIAQKPHDYYLIKYKYMLYHYKIFKNTYNFKIFNKNFYIFKNLFTEFVIISLKLFH